MVPLLRLVCCSSQLFPPITAPWGTSLCQHESETRSPYIHTPLTCLTVESSESKCGLGKCITQAGSCHVVAGGWHGRGREGQGTPDVMPNVEDPRMRRNLNLSLNPNWWRSQTRRHLFCPNCQPLDTQPTSQQALGEPVVGDPLR